MVLRRSSCSRVISRPLHVFVLRGMGGRKGGGGNDRGCRVFRRACRSKRRRLLGRPSLRWSVALYCTPGAGALCPDDVEPTPRRREVALYRLPGSGLLLDRQGSDSGFRNEAALPWARNSMSASRVRAGVYIGTHVWVRGYAYACLVCVCAGVDTGVCACMWTQRAGRTCGST